MHSKVKLGYEINTGEEVFISPAHLIVTGITQQSGKTTTLEALISRSGIKAIVFKTKIGEKSFSSGINTAPFFRDRSDYEFVRSLIEAYAKEKLNIEKGALMHLCKGSKNLVEIKKRVDDEIATGKLRGIKEEIYTRLQHYLENLIPQIQYANFSSTLHISDGINIMNLERFSGEAQSLIIQSVADEVLKNRQETIIVIPEAWKFIPQKYNNPCKRVVESFIRQGAANNNYVWLDSQDMAGVDKIPLKQISTWILGYQSERNEVKHTLDQIPLPKTSRPKEDEIMNLEIGHFILSSREAVAKVYVQPEWMNDEDARAISMWQKTIADVVASKPLSTLNFHKWTAAKGLSNSIELNKTLSPDGDYFAKRSDLQQIRIDFFNKIRDLITEVNNHFQNLQPPLAPNSSFDEDHIVSLVLQNLPQSITNTSVDNDLIIAEVLKRLPASTGNVMYKVAPLEKIKKDFLQEIKNRIVSDISSISADEKKALKYIEARDKDVTPGELISSCFMLKSGGSSSVKISNILKSLKTIDVVEATAGGRYRKGLQKRISSLMNNHNATEAEIQNTYNHILNDLL